MRIALSVDVAALSFEQVFDPDVYGNGDPATFGLPLELYERMREEAPCVKLQLDDPFLIDEVWVVTRHEDVCRVSGEVDNFVSDRNLPSVTRTSPIDPVHHPGILVQDGEKHRESRQALGRAFRPTTLNKLEERFHRHAEVVVDGAVAKGSFDFITEIAHELPVRALGDVLGVPEEDRPKLFASVDAFVSPYDPRIAPSLEEAANAVNEIWAYALEIVQRKRAEPGDDVLSVLAAMDIPDNEVQGHVAVFAAGAAETTRSVLGHALHELMREPEQMAWLRERRDDIPAEAIQEFVRIATPAITVLRTAINDVELDDEVVEEGDLIAPLFPAANFDSTVIPDPRLFDLSRSPNEHVSFGRGSHSCIGRHVAALEIKILLGVLLDRTRDIRPTGPIDYVKSNLTRGVYSLPVAVTPA